MWDDSEGHTLRYHRASLCANSQDSWSVNCCDRCRKDLPNVSLSIFRRRAPLNEDARKTHTRSNSRRNVIHRDADNGASQSDKSIPGYRVDPRRSEYRWWQWQFVNGEWIVWSIENINRPRLQSRDWISWIMFLLSIRCYLIQLQFYNTLEFYSVRADRTWKRFCRRASLTSVRISVDRDKCSP